MRSIRVEKGGKRGGRRYHAIHALESDERTICGLIVDSLFVLDELELELEDWPAIEACGLCKRFIERTPRHRSPPADASLRQGGPHPVYGRAKIGDQKAFHRIYPH